MRTVLALLFNDLKRDWKHPWWMLLLAALPLVMSLLIGGVFSGPGGSGPAPILHMAVLDQDGGMLTRMLRSLPAQQNAGKRLDLRFVQTREEGLRLVERRKVSAFIVLPQGMTDALLEGRTNSIELYENPAEQILPRVARQGTSLLALGLSSAAEILGDPLRDMRALFRGDEFPMDTAVGDVAKASAGKLRGLRTYLFPPLVKFETIAAADYTPCATNVPAASPQP